MYYLDNLFYTTGFIIWLGIVVGIVLIILAIIWSYIKSAIFTLRINRALKRANKSVTFKQLFEFWHKQVWYEQYRYYYRVQSTNEVVWAPFVKDYIKRELEQETY